MKKDHILTLSDGEKLNITSFGKNTREDTPAIIYVHGFKGFKDWGFVPYIGDYLASKGFFVVTFNFSHNGIGSSLTEFTELDKFAANTLSREVRELSELIDAFHDGYFGNSVSPLGLLGHSRGGGIALLTGRQKQEIKAIVTWASVAGFARYSEDIEKRWRQKGYYEVINQRTGQVMRLNLSMLEDIKKNKDDLLNIEKAAKGGRRPLLVIHGENDEAVPVDEARRIHKWAGADRSELFIAPATGHTFDAKHPFEGSNPNLDSVLLKTSEFFDKNL